jgi:hypothetical protein
LLPERVMTDGSPFRSRGPQAALVASTLLASWLGMQAVHELGHVLGAWSTGGTVERIVLHPFSFSRTDLGANPHPLIVAWAGPLFGCLALLTVWMAAFVAVKDDAFLLRFFAGFCLIANGGYLGGGSFSGDGDCGDILRHDPRVWVLWVFGVAAVVAGLALWHGQGPHFGFGASRGTVSQRAVAASTVAAAILLAIALGVGRS